MSILGNLHADNTVIVELEHRHPGGGLLHPGEIQDLLDILQTARSITEITYYARDGVNMSHLAVNMAVGLIPGHGRAAVHRLYERRPDADLLGPVDLMRKQQIMHSAMKVLVGILPVGVDMRDRLEAKVSPYDRDELLKATIVLEP